VKPKDIGLVVKTRRSELKLTTTALAKKVRISQAQISRLENGEQGFRSDMVERLAEALRIPPFRLFMTDGEWKRWLKRK
jgi:transcriptional regulator with XRE-family HTH domain